MSRNVSLPNSLPFSLERRKTMVTSEVRFVPTKDNYIKMPPQKFALSSPHSFFLKKLCVRKSLEFSFFPTFVCFYKFFTNVSNYLFRLFDKRVFFSSLYLRNFARENWRTAGKSWSPCACAMFDHWVALSLSVCNIWTCRFAHIKLTMCWWDIVAWRLLWWFPILSR